MSKWTNDELTKINAADELQLSTKKDDGTLRNPVTVWVVRAGDDVFVRAVYGQTSKWFLHAVETGEGQISAGSVTKEVTFEPAHADVIDDVDKAYKAKYSRYSDSMVGSTLTVKAKAATLQLVPVS
jgi:hypothetical protein